MLTTKQHPIDHQNISQNTFYDVFNNTRVNKRQNFHFLGVQKTIPSRPLAVIQSTLQLVSLKNTCNFVHPFPPQSHFPNSKVIIKHER